MFHGIAELVAQYGYAIVVLFLLGEGIGIPLPGEAALVVAAAFAAKGRLSIAGVIAAGTLGAMLGGVAGFWIGRLGGQALFKHQRRLGLGDERLQRAQRFFARLGPPSVFLARFVAVLRTVVPMLAGISRMSFGRFFLYNALGGVAWASLLGSTSHFFGRRLEHLPAGSWRAGGALALLAVLVWGLTFLWRRLRDRGTRYTRVSQSVVHAIAGLATSIVSMLLFAAITDRGFDADLVAWLEGGPESRSDSFRAAFGALGEPWLLGALASAVGLLLALSGRWADLLAWLVALAGTVVLNIVLTQLFRVPGAHLVAPVVVYGMIAYLVPHMLAPAPQRDAWTRVLRVTLVWVAVAVTGAIAVSRVYVEAQSYSDVVSAAAAGVTWLFVCLTGLELGRGRSGIGAAQRDSSTPDLDRPQGVIR